MNRLIIHCYVRDFISSFLLKDARQYATNRAIDSLMIL